MEQQLSYQGLEELPWLSATFHSYTQNRLRIIGQGADLFVQFFLQHTFHARRLFCLFIGRHQEPQFIFSIIENEGAYEYSLLNNSNNNIQKRRAKPVSCRLFLFHSLIEFEVATKMRIRAFTSQNISPLSAAVRERDLRSVNLSNRAE
jgi:hypothetical protein